MAVWGGLEVVCGGLVEVWGGLWCFGGGLGCFNGPHSCCQPSVFKGALLISCKKLTSAG